MTRDEFFKKVCNSRGDLLRDFVELLKGDQVAFCVIGGLAVNAYVEPVVSLDLDVVVVSDRLGELLPILKKRYRVKTFANSINIGSASSDVRIQIRTDERYQAFLPAARTRNVLGYRLRVAAVEDVLRGKIWAALDESRRPSKRQKDLADIARLIEAKKELARLVPAELMDRLV